MNDSNKKIYVIFHGRFPGEKAASLFAAKSCEAFAGEGLDVELIVPRRKELAEGNPFAYYGVEENFTLHYVGVVDLFSFPISKKISFWISHISFVISSTFFILKNGSKGDVVYSNEAPNLLVLSFFRPNTFYEMHDFPESKLGVFGIFLKRMKWILVHNRWKIEKLFELFPNIEKSKVLHQVNAVSVQDFTVDVSKVDARASLGLDEFPKIVLYTGHLYGWKGVETLAESIDYLPNEAHIVFVGGTEEDVVLMSGEHGYKDRLHFLGHRQHSEIPLYQKAADVLVIPNTAKEDISKYYTSPMKLFEYMASGRPIVASDLPSIREIADDSMVTFSTADDSKSLAHAIVEVLEGSESIDIRAQNAYREVQKYTWSIRAKNIIKHINY